VYRILIIDDEPNILAALRRCLMGIDVRQLDGAALVIETFASPEAAIERCEEQDFDLLISDYRMPSMNGVEVLSRLMEVQPSVPRVIISAFADRDAIIAAINEAHLSQFIEKPWNDAELRASITSLLRGAAKGAAARGLASSRTGLDPAVLAERQLKRLEKDSPGITQVERDDDGGIMIASGDWGD
jgi:two-component system, probable response regulator PhcQ